MGLEMGEEKGEQPVGEGKSQTALVPVSLPPMHSHSQPSPTDWITTGDTNSNKHRRADACLFGNSAGLMGPICPEGGVRGLALF